MELNLGKSLSTKYKNQKEYLLHAPFDKICRTCLSSDEEFLNMFEITHQGMSLSKMFASYIPVQVEPNDNLPQNICRSCMVQLIQTYMFVQQCEHSDSLLRATLNDRIEKAFASQNTVKVEVLLEESQISNESLKSVDPLVIHVPNLKEMHELINSNSDTNFNLRCPKLDQNETDTNDDMHLKTDIKEEDQNEFITNSSCSSQHLQESESQSDKPPTSLFPFIKLEMHQNAQPQNLVCPICNKPFVSNSKLQQHIRTHTGEKPFHCEICQMQFAIKHNLQRHMMQHTGERPHVCELCGKGFVQAECLVEHKRIHTGETPFACNYCDKQFARRNSYQTHLKKHLIENQELLDNTTAQAGHNKLIKKCDVCHRLFPTQAQLRQHMATHEEKTFLCNYCGKGFALKGNLKTHLKVHTGDKPYACKECNKAFAQMGSLKSHSRIHTGEKPYVCKICGKAFIQHNQLVYHSRTHSKEKPYKCSFCDELFSFKSTLIVHTRIHTGETPYVCSICGKGFYHCNGLKKHKKVHGQLDEKEKVLNEAAADVYQKKLEA